MQVAALMQATITASVKQQKLGICATMGLFQSLDRKKLSNRLTYAVISTDR